MKKNLDITGNPVIANKISQSARPFVIFRFCCIADPGLQEIRYTTFQSWLAILKTDESTIKTFTIILWKKGARFNPL